MRPRRQQGLRGVPSLPLRATLVVAALAAVLYLGPLAPPLHAAPADTLTLQLSPASIIADGVSTTTATATVTAAGVPVDNETVQFTTTDPGEQISATTQVGGGSGQYTATITSSTTAGSVTITATDTTASPFPLTTSKTLNQTPGPASHVSVSLAPASIVANGVSTTTATATVVDANVNPVPGDTVTFSPTPQGAVTDNGDGTYTATIKSTTTAGRVPVTATDTTAGITSPPASLRQTSGNAATVAVTLSPSSIVANGTSATTATAIITDAHGNPVQGDAVVFSSSDPGDVVGGTTAPASGTYTATIRSSTTVGTPTITATDTSAGGASGHATLTQTAAGSTVVLSASPTKAITNQPVTLVATVQTTSGPPAGAVTFRAGANAISGCASLPVAVTGSIGTVTCTTSFAAASQPGALTAVFAPSGTSSLGATSAAVSLTLTAAPSATTLGFPVKTKTGAKATYSATVSTSETGAVSPGGTVAFSDGTTRIKKCAAVAVTAGVATCQIVFRRAGKHAITASYGGDPNFVASASSPATTTVSAPPPTVFPNVTSTMTWSFLRTKTYSQVISLRVSKPPPTGSIVISCSGPGCRFKSKTVAVPSQRKCSKGKCTAQAASVLDLTAQLHTSKLGVGAKLQIVITRKHYNGKYYLFTITTAGPHDMISCLHPGQKKPGTRCTPQ